MEGLSIDPPKILNQFLILPTQENWLVILFYTCDNYKQTKKPLQNNPKKIHFKIEM